MTPQQLGGLVKREYAQHRLEEIRFALLLGMTVAQICGIPGLPPTPAALYRFLYRRGEAELARTLGLARREHRQQRAA